MPNWFFDKKGLRHTPSSRDGIDFETESRYRKEGSRFISDVGADLNLKHDTVATGCTYFHRFFMFHSFKDFHRYVAALGCLFLAGKVEETPKKCRDMIRAARQRLNDEQFAAFGEDPREELMTLERVLLQTIKFDLQIDHPYQYLLKYAKVLKGDQEKIQKMVQMAWTFINDSFCTTLCLQWEPEIVAIALMYLACRLTKFDVEDWQGRTAGKPDGKWWDQFVEDMSMDLLEEICHLVLDLYSNTNSSDKDKSQQKKSSMIDPTGVPQTVSSASTPSPGSTGKTPTCPPTPGTTATTHHSAPTTPAKPGNHNQPPSFPSTPVSVPPPPPMPSYAYPVSMPPSGNPPQPPMGYPGPGGAAGPVYTFNYNMPPPTVAGTTAPPMGPVYAVPSGGYGPRGHYEYRPGPTGPPMQPQPTYGVPSTVPHAYNVPPMHRHPPGFVPPPPPHQRMPPHQSQRRI